LRVACRETQTTVASSTTACNDSGNSFDTHVQQAGLHSRLLMYTADAVRGFIKDVGAGRIA